MGRAIQRFAAWAVLVASLLAVAGCGGGGTTGGSAAPPAAVTPPATSVPVPPASVASAVALANNSPPLITLSSDAGDDIGQGASYSYDNTNASIQLTPHGPSLSVEVKGQRSWSATFVLPGTLRQLQPGTYTDLKRYPFQSRGEGAMTWGGGVRVCNTLSGVVTIYSVTYDAGLLQALDMSFEQRCGGAAGSLKGRIRIDANAMASVTRPGNGLSADPVVSLDSDTGDYIGGGISYGYDLGNAAITVKAVADMLTVKVVGDQSWDGRFQMPAGAEKLAVGTYTQMTLPHYGAPTGGLDWSGESRACDASGAMTINSLRYDGAGQLAAIDMDFEQHCNADTPALHGHIAWDANQSAPVPAPLSSAPAGLWTPPEDAMPATGNAMYLSSDWGDSVGQGYIYTVRTVTASDPPPPSHTGGSVDISLGESGGLLKLGLTGAVTWDIQFKAMDGLPHLQPGYYGIVRRYPLFYNPRRGGMYALMDGRGCYDLSGWFMVDKIAYQGGKLVSVDLRFAQYCDGSIAALRGRIRWSLGSSAQ